MVDFFWLSGKAHAMCLLRWGKTHAAFLPLACAMACLGSNHVVAFLYRCSFDYLAFPMAKNNCGATKLGHVPNPSLSTVADDHGCKKLQ